MTADVAPKHTDIRSDLVVIDGNPPPEGAETIWIEGKDGKRVRIMFAAEPKGPPKTRGTVIVMPGRTEFIEKYFEVGRDLQARGFAVVIFDWPGQGLSERLLPNPALGHVRSYNVYIEALVKGMTALARRAPRPWVVLAHSMGGAIALEALRTQRLEVAAAAFSAPMWGIPILFFQRWYARFVRFFLGLGAMPARKPLEETFENNQLTHDETRWGLYRRLIDAEPRLAVGEPTVGWVVSSLNTLREFFKPRALDPLAGLPMLIAIAEEEKVVSKSAQRRVAGILKGEKVLNVKDAKHEILMETDDKRALFWEAFDKLCKQAKI